MSTGQQKSHIIYKKTAISLVFKDIFCFQSRIKYFFPILQIFDDPGSISISQGNQSPSLIKHPY